MGSKKAKSKVEFEPEFLERLSFRFPKLRAALDSEQYLVHQAALEWSLDAPITIRDEQDILSRREWADRFDPYAHQIQNLITFCRRAPVALLADDVGLGKTISAGLILSELMVRRKVERALVVAPKLLLPQWQEELAVKFNIAADTASGANLKNAVRGRMPVVITTYHSARNYLDDLRHAGFDMIIMDEAHKLRNLHGTHTPPKFAVGIRKALADRWFKYALMLTATPIQNRLWDLYSLVDLLTAARGIENPLGSPPIFKGQYIADSQGVEIKRGMREEFRRHISSCIVRTRRGDAKLLFPDRRVETYRVNATICESKLIGIVGALFRDGGRKINGLAQSSIGQALMSSPQALLAQLQNMQMRGTIPVGVFQEVEEVVGDSPASGKLKGLLNLVEELKQKRPDDWRVVVFTSRKVTQQVIGDALKDAGIPVGFIQGGRAQQNERAIRDFRETPPGVRVLVSTDAGAEGVNLQVANVLVNFDLPWNPMVLEQRIGRIQRLASTHAEVVILNLVLAGSVEEKVVLRLSSKLQAISESLGDIEAILESMGSGDSEKDSMENIIRLLVVKSLKGMDFEKATSKAVQSIENAKKLFEEEKETVEHTLGDLRDLHRSGPTVPEITPVEPSIKSRDFVLRALKADGATIRVTESDVIDVSLPGQNRFKITFKDRSWDSTRGEGHFGSTAPRLYLPGKRDFERLSQSWSEKACALFVDRQKIDDKQIESVVEQWLEQVEGAELADFKVLDKRVILEGGLVCRASIANEVDRLEKLVEVSIKDELAPALDKPTDNEEISRATVYEDIFPKDLVVRVAEAIASEEDLAKFSAFYDDRLEEELPNVSDSKAEKRLEERFIPGLAAEAVGFSGVRSAILTVEADVKIDGHGPMPISFKLLPQSNRVEMIEADELVMCPKSGRKLPLGATASCAITGVSCAVWELQKCAVTGELALADELIACDITGDLVMPSQVGECAVTGKIVKNEFLKSSALSDSLALDDSLVTCDFTKIQLLPTEAKSSDISGKRYRVDQEAFSVLSRRRGHQSEFVMSVDPKGLIALDESSKSDFSGSWCATERLIQSEVNPSRKCLESEGVRCVLSKKWLLNDEAGRSEISGAVACPDLLKKCDFTKSKVLPSELEESQISGKQYRNDQGKKSSLSHVTGHKSEFVESEIPKGWLARSEAEQSAVSGKWGDKNQMVHSDLDLNRCGFPNEAAVCEATGRQLLIDEVAVSMISGKSVGEDLLYESPVSGRMAMKEEMVKCDQSGKYLCPDEIAKCEVSGQLVDLRLLATSKVSGRKALKKMMLKCGATGRAILPEEAVRCAITGQMVSHDSTAECTVTGRIATKNRMKHVGGLPEYLYIEDQVTKQEVTNRTGQSSIVCQCEWSCQHLLTIDTVVCKLTGLRVAKSIVNAQGEIADVRDLMNGEIASRATRVPQSQLQDLKKRASLKISGGVSLSSHDEHIQVLCLSVKSGLLGFSTDYALVVHAIVSEEIKVIKIGKRLSGEWQLSA